MKDDAQMRAGEQESERAALLEQVAVAETKPLPGPGVARSVLVTAFVVLMLGAPIFFLSVKYKAPQALASEQVNVQTPAPTVNLAALEQAAHASPTPTNELNLSAAYLNLNEPARARPVLDELLKANPRNAGAWNNYCLLHMQQQDYPAAIDACNRAVEIAPDLSLARNNLKWANDERQKTLQAIADDEHASPADQNETLYLRLGLNDMHVERYDDAIHAWANMLSLNPKNAVAANNIGTAYMLKHQYGEGAAWFQKAIAFDATNQLFKNNLAWANDELAKSGK